MAVMSDGDRIACWEQWMRENLETITGSMTKAEFRAAVDATDQWVSDNSASYNSAIPQPARGAMSNSQKAFLLSVVLLKRFKVGA
jgi:hypothetical protein